MKFLFASLVLFLSITSYAASWQKIYVGIGFVCHPGAICADVVADVRAPKPVMLYQGAMAMSEKVSDELRVLNDSQVHICDAKMDGFLAFPGSSSVGSSSIAQIFELKNCQ